MSEFVNGFKMLQGYVSICCFLKEAKEVENVIKTLA
jgi:hypothetical protein